MNFKFQSLAIATIIGLTTLSWGATAYGQTTTAEQSQQSTPATENPQTIPAQETSWKEINNEKGNFTIKIPGKPMYKKEGETGYTYESETDLGIFSISFSNFGQQLAGQKPEDVLNQFADSLGQSGGKIISQTDINIGEHPGKEVQFEMLDGYVKGMSRIYLVEQQLYVLFAIAEPANAQIFFDSFALK